VFSQERVNLIVEHTDYIDEFINLLQK